MPVTGYYDGTAVRTDANFSLNQKVLIIPIGDDYFDGGTAAGMLQEYADPDLISQESDIWRRGAIERHM